MDNQDFIAQFEDTLNRTLETNDLEQASQLISAYPKTQMPYTIRIYRLINILRQKRQPFSITDSSHAFRLIIYMGHNYILNYIATQFTTYFKSIGYDPFLFDATNFQESSDALFEFLKEGADAAFFFNNLGLAQSFQDGTNLWEALNLPCFDCLVDHPMYYADSLNEPPVHTTLICADQNHAAYANRFYTHIERAIFLPTGGAFAPNPPDFSWSKRPMDVLFIGSYKCNNGYPYDELDTFVMSYLQNHTNEDFVSVIELYVKEQMYLSGISDEALKEIIESHRFLETNLTALYRREIIKNIVEQGICIHVYGDGWESSGLMEHPCFIHHDPVSFEEGIALMQHTKLLLNHMAWFKSGSSERIFNAMSQGALCITDSSYYLKNILVDDKNCLLYDLDHIEEVSVKIKSILGAHDKASAIAREGYFCSQNHTWQDHLKELL